MTAGRIIGIGCPTEPSVPLMEHPWSDAELSERISHFVQPPAASAFPEVKNPLTAAEALAILRNEGSKPRTRAQKLMDDAIDTEVQRKMRRALR